MKKLLSTALLAWTFLFTACEADTDWAKGTPNPTISISDIRSLYKDGGVTLTKDNMAGAIQICGVVSSDYTAGNLPEGIVFLQHIRRSKTSGIAVDLGEFASALHPGDSVILRVEGRRLSHENGTLVIKSLSENDITLLDQGHKLAPIPVKASALLENPAQYESVLVKVSNCAPVETPEPGSTYEGDLKIQDGTGELILHTESGSELSSKLIPENPASYIGLVFTSTDDEGNPVVSIWPRSKTDVIEKYVILAWNLTGYNITQGPTRDATIVNANLSVSALSRGPGLTAAQASNAFSATWPMDADLDAAMRRGSYYQFTIEPKNGSILSLMSIDIALRVQANGPKNYIWMYSLDDGETFQSMSGNLVFSGSTSDNNGIQQPTLDVSDKTGVQEFSTPMLVRIYAWGAANTSSTFRIGQSLSSRPYALSVEGTVQTQE